MNGLQDLPTGKSAHAGSLGGSIDRFAIGLSKGGKGVSDPAASAVGTQARDARPGCGYQARQREGRAVMGEGERESESSKISHS